MVILLGFALAVVGAWVTAGTRSALAQDNTATATDIANPDGYACTQPGFVGFETLVDGTTLPGTIAGLTFATTGGYTWLAGDFATGHYNGKYPNGQYTSQGTHWAWLGPNQGAGRIDFQNGHASYFSLLASVGASPVYLEAYDSGNNLVATAGPASYDLGTGHMTELKITRSSFDMAYVIVHDTGNFFLIDSVCTDASGVSENPGVPGPPTNLVANVGNGSASLQWLPPANRGTSPITDFEMEATPWTPSLNSTVPPGDASTVTANQHVVTLRNLYGGAMFDLRSDCHTSYTFRVAARNASGLGAFSAPVGPFRPSGLVTSGDPAPTVVIVIDGAPSSITVQGNGNYDPFSASSYCPETPEVASAPQNGGTVLPLAISPFISKWNYDGGSAPRDLSTGAFTHRYLLDWYASYGAIVFPYSYEGVKYSSNTGLFQVHSYTESDTTNGDLDGQAKMLHREITAIHAWRPLARVIVFGHSYGGLVAEWYWQHCVPGSCYGSTTTDGLSHLFSLDSPINGIANCRNGIETGICSGNGYTPAIASEFTALWIGIEAHDTTIINSDGTGTYRAVGTEGDPAYGLSDFPSDGLISQLVFTGCSGPAANCTPVTPPSILSPCPVTDAVNSAVQGAGHFVVKYCPDLLSQIESIAP